MDVYPLDTGSQRGGDGVLNSLDLLALLRRAAGLDTSRPTRASLAKTCASAVPSAASPAGAEGVLEFGGIESAAPGLWRVPIYLRPNVDLNLLGLALSIGYDPSLDTAGPRLVSGVQAPSLADNGLPGKIALAWLDGWQLKALHRALLGYVMLTSRPQAESMSLLGVSANEANSGRTVSLRQLPNPPKQQ